MRSSGATVGDDPRGTLRARLQGHLNEARELTIHGPLVDRHDAFVAWRERQRGWREATAETVRDEFEREAHEEFLHATIRTNTSPERWRQTLRGEMRRIEDAIELLLALQSTLGAWSGSGPPRTVGEREAPGVQPATPGVR